jgi:DNA uptake protein ComE-like DNA-binding protein
VHGTFQKLEDVKQVKGIGDGIYAKIKSKIKLE